MNRNIANFSFSIKFQCFLFTIPNIQIRWCGQKWCGIKPKCYPIQHVISYFPLWWTAPGKPHLKQFFWLTKVCASRQKPWMTDKKKLRNRYKWLILSAFSYSFFAGITMTRTWTGLQVFIRVVTVPKVGLKWFFSKWKTFRIRTQSRSQSKCHRRQVNVNRVSVGITLSDTKATVMKLNVCKLSPYENSSTTSCITRCRCRQSPACQMLFYCIQC